MAELISTKRMTLFTTVSDDYRFELINEAPDFKPLRQALLNNSMLTIEEKSSELSTESIYITACKLLLVHPNYVLLELDSNFFICPFDLTQGLLEICPENALVIMTSLGFSKRSIFLEPMTRYAEYHQAEDSRGNDSINRKQYQSTLKSDIVKVYNIPLNTLLYVFAVLLVGHLFGFASLIVERRNGRKCKNT